MSQAIIKRQQKLMAREGLDAIIAASPEMIRYTTGVMIPSQSIIRERHAFCITPAKGSPTAIVVNIEEGLVKSESPLEDIRPYNEFTQDPVSLLAKIIKEKGLYQGKIGIEMDYVPAKRFNLLTQELPQVQFLTCEDYFYELRMLKTQEEIALIKKIGKAAEDSIDAAFASLKPGMTEQELASMLVSEFFRRGGEETKILVVGTGERSSFLNASASDRVIQEGDMIRVDLIGTRQGYYSDVCRTAVVGEPTKEQLQIWDTLIAARHLVLDQVKPGADTREIYQEYKRFVAEKGLTPIDFVGHGLGLGLHEEPYLGKYGGTVLEPGMVFCVEPIHIVPNKMGFQHEDEILITDTGYQLLTGESQSFELPVI